MFLFCLHYIAGQQVDCTGHDQLLPGDKADEPQAGGEQVRRGQCEHAVGVWICEPDGH